jgi:hypothetical protein
MRVVGVTGEFQANATTIYVSGTSTVNSSIEFIAPEID